MPTTRTLWCLHGNLQQPSVWGHFAERLQTTEDTNTLCNLTVRTVNLWTTLMDNGWVWAQDFCDTVVRSQFPPSPQSSNHYLLGYSLGGRLALHALLTAPDLWSGAVIVSADPGISEAQQRADCMKRDRTWANRFLTEPWHQLLADWDRLSVFCNRPCSTPRHEAEFDRLKIARAFEVYSKGKMDDLRSHIPTLTTPITYVTGADDQRYCQIGKDLAAQNPSIHHITIPNAGHRVPWEQPEPFFRVLVNALQ